MWITTGLQQLPLGSEWRLFVILRHAYLASRRIFAYGCGLLPASVILSEAKDLFNPPARAVYLLLLRKSQLLQSGPGRTRDQFGISVFKSLFEGLQIQLGE